MHGTKRIRNRKEMRAKNKLLKEEEGSKQQRNKLRNKIPC